jgi:hypothetical protein
MPPALLEEKGRNLSWGKVEVRTSLRGKKEAGTRT